MLVFQLIPKWQNYAIGIDKVPVPILSHLIHLFFQNSCETFLIHFHPWFARYGPKYRNDLEVDCHWPIVEVGHQVEDI